MTRLVEPEDAQPCPECGELRSVITTDAGSPPAGDERAPGSVPRYGCANEECQAYDVSATAYEGQDPEEPAIEANQPTGADDVGA